MTKLEAWKKWCEESLVTDATDYTLEMSSHGKAFSAGWNLSKHTLRDRFAGLAMQGMLSNPKLQEQILKTGGAMGGWIEESAYGWADGMLKAREKK